MLFNCHFAFYFIIKKNIKIKMKNKKLIQTINDTKMTLFIA